MATAGIDFGDSNDYFDNGVIDVSALGGVPISGGLDGVPFGNGGSDPLNSGGFYAADPSGMWGVGTNPTVNPNPTGGWMTTAQSVLNLAATGFKAFSAGSPSVSIPKPQRPSTGLALPSVTASGVGQVKWGTIAAIGVGVIVVAALVKYA